MTSALVFEHSDIVHPLVVVHPAQTDHSINVPNRRSDPKSARALVKHERRPFCRAIFIRSMAGV